MSDATDERRGMVIYNGRWDKLPSMKIARAIRASDEAAGLVLIYKDALEILKRDAAKGAGDE